MRKIRALSTRLSFFDQSNNNVRPLNLKYNLPLASMAPINTSFNIMASKNNILEQSLLDRSPIARTKRSVISNLYYQFAEIVKNIRSLKTTGLAKA